MNGSSTPRLDLIPAHERIGRGLRRGLVIGACDVSARGNDRRDDEKGNHQQTTGIDHVLLR